MGRRKQSNVLEDLVNIASKLPWWAGVTLATVFFATFHHFAGLPQLVATGGLNDMPAVMQRTMVVSFCRIFQYIIPIALLIGAGISAWKTRRADQLLEAARESPAPGKLAAFSWQEFEALVGAAFREQGYAVKVRGGNGPDGGVDIELQMGSDTYLVQCKHWKAQAVGVSVVRELFGVMSAERAVGAFVVASGQFTSEAAKFAEGRSIKLIDANTLISRVRKPDTHAIAQTPSCPRCGAEMVLRTARNTGSEFWGCRTFPKCRGVRSHDSIQA